MFRLCKESARGEQAHQLLNLYNEMDFFLMFCLDVIQDEMGIELVLGWMSLLIFTFFNFFSWFSSVCTGKEERPGGQLSQGHQVFLFSI